MNRPIKPECAGQSDADRYHSDLNEWADLSEVYVNHLEAENEELRERYQRLVARQLNHFYSRKERGHLEKENKELREKVKDLDDFLKECRT